MTQTRTHLIIALVLLSTGAAVSAAPVRAQDVADPFVIGYGDTVADGVPAPGAGNIELAGAVDSYSFAAEAGDVAIFDVLTGSGGDFRWRLEAPDGRALFDGLYVDRRAELPETGTYTLRVRGSTATTVGTYSFRILLTPPSEEFTIAVGDTVSDGVPEPGAGNLEGPGAIDRYRFDATAGQVAILDALTRSNDVRWELHAPDGTEVFHGLFVDQEVTLPQTGIYTLTVIGLSITSSGVYSFRLVDVPPRVDEFTIAFGDTVSDGVPEAGAGNVEGPGAVDRYRFEGTAGQVAILDVLGGSTVEVRWSLHAPDGSEVFDAFFVDQQVVLSQTGTYTLEVSGQSITSFGVYSFALSAAIHEPPNRAPTVADVDDQDNVVGDQVNLQVDAGDADGDELAYAAGALPPGLAIDGASGEIAGTIEPGAELGSPYTVAITVTDPDGATATTSFRWTVNRAATGSVTVDVDILPRCLVNDGNGVIPVLIFGSDGVAADTLDLATVELEGMPVRRRAGRFMADVRDVDGDRIDDLFVLIDDVAGAIPAGATTARVSGRLRDGTTIEGADDIRLLPGRV